MILIRFWQITGRWLLFFIAFFITINGLKAQEDSTSTGRLYPVWHKEKWYFMDSCGDVPQKDLNPAKVYFTQYEGNFIVGNEKFGLLNYYLDTILPIQFDTIISHQEYVLAKSKDGWLIANLYNGKQKLLTVENVEVIDRIIYFFNKEKTGMILWDNSKNDFLVTEEYERIAPYLNYFLTYRSGKFGLLDQLGAEILKPEYKEIQIDHYGIISYFDSYWKYILMGGKKIDPGVDRSVYFYSTFYWKIKQPDGNFILYSLNSEKPILSGYDNYFLLNDYFVAIRKNDKSGLATIDGKILFQPKFDFVGFIESDLFYYKKDDLLGLINSKGEILSEALFTDIQSGDRNFENQLKINTDGKYGVMIRNGKILVPSEFRFVAVYDGGNVTYNKNLYGLYGENGKKLSDCIYNGHTVYSDPLNGNVGTGKRQFDLYKLWTNDYFDFYTKNEKLNSLPCSNYSLGNNTLKCYCEKGIEVINLNDSGDIDSRMLYEDVPVIVVRDTLLKLNKRIEMSGRVAVLEEDQSSGKFSMRFSKKKGYGFTPLSNQIYSTKYQGYYSGKVDLDTIPFKVLGNDLSIQHFDLSFSTSDGLLYTKDTLVATDLYWGSGGMTTSLDFMFTRDQDINFFTGNLPDKNIRYIDRTQNYIQKIYSGGNMKLSSDMNVGFTLWNYFQRFNSNNNIWMSNHESVMKMMDPHSRVAFENGNWKVFHGPDDGYREDKKKRYFNGKQSFNHFEQSNDLYWHIFSSKKKKYGYIGRFGEMVLPEIFDTLYRIDWDGGNSLIGNCASESKVYYDIQLNSLYNEFSNPGNFRGNLAIVKNGKHYGLIDRKEKPIYSYGSKQIEWIDENFLKVLNGNGYSIINRNGKKISTIDYEMVRSLDEGKFLFMSKGKVGIMDTLCNVILPNIYDSIVPLEDGYFARNSKEKDIYSEGMLKVRSLVENEKFKNGWFITRTGKKKFRLEKFPDKPFEISTEMEPQIVNDLIRVKNKKGKYTFYDEKGKILMQSNAGSILKITDELTAIKDKSQWNIYDETNEIIFTGEADEFIDFGMWIKILVKDSSFLITRNGLNVNLDPKIIPVKKSIEGRIICKHKSQFAFYDVSGNRISEFYETVRDFSDGYAAVSIDSKWGFINAEGKLVVEPQFESVSDFSSCRFYAGKKSRCGMYTQYGVQKLPAVFTKLIPLGDRIFMMTEESSGYYFQGTEMIWPSLD